MPRTTARSSQPEALTPALQGPLGPRAAWPLGHSWPWPASPSTSEPAPATRVGSLGRGDQGRRGQAPGRSSDCAAGTSSHFGRSHRCPGPGGRPPPRASRGCHRGLRCTDPERGAHRPVLSNAWGPAWPSPAEGQGGRCAREGLTLDGRSVQSGTHDSCVSGNSLCAPREEALPWRIWSARV